MPRLDFIHNAVKNALIKDGWSVTDDSYVIEYRKTKLFIVNKHQLPLIVVDTELEEIVQWIN